MKPCGHRACTRTAAWRIRNLHACDQHKTAAEAMYPGVEAVPLQPAPSEDHNEGDSTMTTGLCATALDGYDITCDLPEGHDGTHAGGDRIHWGPAQPGNGPVVQICQPGQVAATSKAFGLPVVSDDGYNHAPECHWCNGTANCDTCPRSVAMAEYVRRFRSGLA